LRVEPRIAAQALLRMREETRRARVIHECTAAAARETKGKERKTCGPPATGAS
jgi:hypothetical protein